MQPQLRLLVSFSASCYQATLALLEGAIRTFSRCSKSLSKLKQKK